MFYQTFKRVHHMIHLDQIPVQFKPWSVQILEENMRTLYRPHFSSDLHEKPSEQLSASNSNLHKKIIKSQSGLKHCNVRSKNRSLGQILEKEDHDCPIFLI